jgi:hypothetical protein
MAKPKDENTEALAEKVRRGLTSSWLIAEVQNAALAALDTLLADNAKWRELYGQAFNDADEAKARLAEAELALERLVGAVKSENFNRPARAPEVGNRLRIALRDAEDALNPERPTSIRATIEGET